jgi:tetratricopeptide (TPR) repeat protein
VLTLAALVLLPAAPPLAAQPAIAFEHVTVVPLDRERVLERHTVLLRGGRIAAVGPDGSLRIPAGTIRVDGSGRYLMPGLADMHVHPYNTDQFLDYLAHGVTTIAVLNGSLDALRWRAEVARGTRLGPTIYSAGPSLEGVPAGNPTFLSTATPEDGRQAVRAIAAAGFDFVKVYMTLTPATYRAILAEAKARGIAVVGHIPPGVGVDSVLAGGQVLVAHAEEFFRERVDSARGAERMADIVRRVKAARVTVIPNLVAYADYIRAIKDLPAVLADPEMRYASPAAYSEKLPSHHRSIRPNPAQFLAGAERGLARMRVFTRMLRDAGVPLLLGTDTEFFGFAGQVAHQDLEELVSAGLSPYQALVAATRAPGEFVRASLRGAAAFGTVAAGQRADLVLLAANPLESIGNASRIEGVVVRGRWLPAARLAALRDSLAASFAPRRAEVLRFDSLITAGRLDDAEATLRALRRAHTGGPPIAQIVLWVKAQRLLARDTAGAVRLLEWNAELYPQSHSAHAELARGYLARGDTARARAEARRALAIFPTHAPAKQVLRTLGTEP